MNDNTYFFDSYALIEIVRGNPGYQEYVHASCLTTKMNLLEVVYAFLREEKIEAALTIVKEFQNKVIEPDAFTMIEIAAWKLQEKPKTFSFIDCLGYVLAKKMGIPFLTGDEEFKDKENVVFVR